MKNSKCLIVTVNFRAATLCEYLVESICKYVVPSSQIHMVIVDNDSNDGSFECIKAFIERYNIDFIDVVRNSNNGFAGGNNAGIRHAIEKQINFDSIWFLNPDTVVHEDTYRKLNNVLMIDGVDCVGSQLLNPHGGLQPSYFRFPTLASEISSGLRFKAFDELFSSRLLKRELTTGVTKCDWVTGASFMITENFFTKVGFMDEKYFLYFEEIDYFFQAKRHGLISCHVPQSKITHVEGATTNIHGGENSRPPRRAKYWFDSRRRYFLKNHGRASLIAYDTCFIIAYSLWLVRTGLLKPNKISKEPKYFLRDFIRNSVFLRGVY